MDYWKRLFFTLAFLLPVALPGMSAVTRDVKLLGLTCNYVEEPIGMGDKKPLLGWRIDTDRAGYLQGSYRVLVASDKALLDADCGDIWDSGIVALLRLLLESEGMGCVRPRIGLEPRCIVENRTVRGIRLGRGMGFVQIRRTASAPQV